MNIASRISSLWTNISRRKPIESLDIFKPGFLRWPHLLAYGISATLGSGVYSVIGGIAKNYTGPSVILSILGSGLLSLFTGFCYLDLAMTINANGVGYIYGYSSLGELVGWTMGWISTLEYAFAGSVTAVSLSINLVNFFEKAGISIPKWLYSIEIWRLYLSPLPFLIIIVTMLVVLKGIEFSSRFNIFLTGFNLTVLLFIICVGGSFTNSSNRIPFFPYPKLQVLRGSSIMIYSYIGFDTICNLCSDTRSNRDLGIGVLGTLVLTTLIYMAIGWILTGMIPFYELDPTTALSSSFEKIGLPWMSYLVGFCAVLMLMATLLSCLIGQPRIFQIMSEDGFLPEIFRRKGKDGSTRWNIFICCISAGIVSCVMRLDSLVDIISLGTLFGFAINALGLLVFRLNENGSKQYESVFCFIYFFGCLLSSFWFHYWTTPGLLILVLSVVVLPFLALCQIFYYKKLTHRSILFYPMMPIIPCVVIMGNFLVIPSIDLQTFVQLFLWIMVGLVLYIGYGYRNSKLRKECKYCDGN